MTMKFFPYRLHSRRLPLETQPWNIPIEIPAETDVCSFECRDCRPCLAIASALQLTKGVAVERGITTGTFWVKDELIGKSNQAITGLTRVSFLLLTNPIIYFCLGRYLMSRGQKRNRRILLSTRIPR
jgi:hypothetical protein